MESSIDTVTRYNSKLVYRKLLGEGAYGIVELYQCKSICNDSNCKDCCVAKHMITIRQSTSTVTSKNYFGLFYQENKENQERIKKFYKEYDIGILLNHPNIRSTLDINKQTNTIFFENCRGIDLLDYANEYKISNTRHLVSFFYQILDAVDYLHKLGIAHLDLKLENIVVNTDTNNIKLIDFGEAAFFKDEQNNNVLFNDMRGTVQYLPPESVDSMGFLGDKTDIWCCGVILYNLFYNIHPWEIARTSDSKYRIHLFNINRDRLSDIIFPNKSEYYTETEWKVIKYLFKTMLNPDHKKRISISKTRSIFGLLKIYDTQSQLSKQFIENSLLKRHTTSF